LDKALAHEKIIVPKKVCAWHRTQNLTRAKRFKSFLGGYQCRTFRMDPTLIALTPWDIFKLALSTGVVTAIINQFVAWLRDWRKESKDIRRNARYGGLRAAIVLESFALGCAECLADQDLHDSSGGHAGKLHGKLPELGAYPADIEWKSLNPPLAGRALAIPIEIGAANRAIGFIWDVTADQDSVADICAEGAAKCGLRAWHLASNVRSYYRLPPLDINQTGWDPIELLSKTDDKYELERKARLRASAQGGS
jgi:hypothetical protein